MFATMLLYTIRLYILYYICNDIFILSYLGDADHYNNNIDFIF